MYKKKKRRFRAKRKVKRAGFLSFLLFAAGFGVYNMIPNALIGNIILILCVIATILIIICIITKRNAEDYKALQKIDAMSGIEFEKMLKYHFEKAGYKVSLTPDTNDYGADLVMTKGGQKTIVQAKRYKGSVNNSAVQEIVAAKAFYHADKCMVVTNSYYTENARNLAKANNVELWNRDRLIKEFSLK